LAEAAPTNTLLRRHLNAFLRFDILSDMETMEARLYWITFFAGLMSQEFKGYTLIDFKLEQDHFTLLFEENRVKLVEEILYKDNRLLATLFPGVKYPLLKPLELPRAASNEMVMVDRKYREDV
jgi:hypothetical protein